MTIVLGIAGVDAETNVEITTPYPMRAIEFLREHDHEGSSTGISITSDNPEEVYNLLEAIRLVPTQH